MVAITEFAAAFVQCAETHDKSCLPAWFLRITEALPVFNTRAITWIFSTSRLMTAF